MRLAVKVHPRSAKPGVEPPAREGEWRVRVRSAPEGGRANAEVVALLADHFNVPRSRVRIVHGVSSRTKVIEIA